MLHLNKGVVFRCGNLYNFAPKRINGLKFLWWGGEGKWGRIGGTRQERMHVGAEEEVIGDY